MPRTHRNRLSKRSTSELLPVLIGPETGCADRVGHTEHKQERRIKAKSTRTKITGKPTIQTASSVQQGITVHAIAVTEWNVAMIPYATSTDPRLASLQKDPTEN
jgi:hypothetical protein